jgi:hypothetical protein
MKVYISGPISLGGTLEAEEIAANLKAFATAERLLRARGHEPVNPVEALDEENPSVDQALWVRYMKRDIPKLVTCDAIYMLPDWELSRGALLERHIADELRLRVLGG